MCSKKNFPKQNFPLYFCISKALFEFYSEFSSRIVHSYRSSFEHYRSSFEHCRLPGHTRKRWKKQKWEKNFKNCFGTKCNWLLEPCHMEARSRYSFKSIHTCSPRHSADGMIGQQIACTICLTPQWICILISRKQNYLSSI